jgi:peptide/nickel transport system permease protein
MFIYHSPQSVYRIPRYTVRIRTVTGHLGVRTDETVPLQSMTEPSSDTPDVAEFERIDWDDHGGWRRWISAERVVLLVGLLAVADLFNYHRRSGDLILIMEWTVGWVDWLLLVSLVVILSYMVVPLTKRPQRVRRLLGHLRGRWATVLGLVILAGLVALGGWATLRDWVPLNTLVNGDSFDTLQPPVGATVDTLSSGDCVGPTSSDGTVCHGSWEYPLGTNNQAYRMTDLLMMGTRPLVYIVLITLGLVMPLATVVGIVAGYRGGLVDDVLMGYVDIQLTMPALAVYLFVYMFLLNTKIMFIVAFGFLSWGGIARIVRSETLQRREEGYVLSARAIGASDGYILRRHIFPNVTNSVVPATFHLISIIILTEAGLGFLGFKPFDRSWGQTIGQGLHRTPPLDAWWVAALPAAALAVTVVSCKLVGDGFRDILDPRGKA